MTRGGIYYIISFLIYLFVQVIFLRPVVLFDKAFCFLYIGFLLLFTVETSTLVLMGAGFIMGISVDIFYDSLGLHAIACVAIMYVRNRWLSAITPQGGYDANTIPSLSANGLQWFVVYSLPLIVVHHLILFFVEAGGFGLFWFTLIKAIASSCFTFLVIVIVQYLFSTRGRRL